MHCHMPNVPLFKILVNDEKEDVVPSLETKLDNWINKYFHFTGLNYQYSLNSGYNFVDNIIYLGIMEVPKTSLAFRQFLYEYGAEKAATEYNAQTLIFLHEFGHVLTSTWFDDLDMIICNFKKQIVDNAIEYWHTPDEFEASIFAANFINENPEAVAELDTIFKGWF